MVKYNTEYNANYNTRFKFVYAILHCKNIIIIQEYVHDNCIIIF